MSERQAIGKRLRFDVFKRDEYRCVYCGATPSETVLLECDHVHPVSKGGATDIDNLVTACRDCNRGKGAIPLTVVPQSLEQKAAEVAEREAQIRAYYEVLEAKKQRKDDEIWSIADVFMVRFSDESISRSRFSSIRMFLERMDYFQVLEAMEIAVDKKHSRQAAFLYFCGVCWRKIKRANGEDI